MTRLVTLLIAFLAASVSVGAQRHQKLWDLDLSRFVDGQKSPYTAVWGISFSPDESKVAIGFGDHPARGLVTEHVIVVSVDSPSVVLRRFDVSVPKHQVSEFAWTPSGTAIVIGEIPGPPVILPLDQTPSCKLPEESRFGGFLSGDRMVLTHDSEIQFFRRDCSPITSWKYSGEMRVLATSPEQNLLAIQTLSTTVADNEIITDTRDVRARWIWSTAEWLAAGHGGYRFVDQGKLFCTGNAFGKDGPYVGVACRDIRSGAIVATDANLNVWDRSIHSSGGGLLAITDYDVKVRNGKLWHLLDAGGTSIFPRRRLIWDARNSREVASWILPPVNPGPVALSPGGKYLAETHLLSAQVYALQP